MVADGAFDFICLTFNSIDLFDQFAEFAAGVVSGNIAFNGIVDNVNALGNFYCSALPAVHGVLVNDKA